MTGKRYRGFESPPLRLGKPRMAGGDPIQVAGSFASSVAIRGQTRRLSLVPDGPNRTAIPTDAPRWRASPPWRNGAVVGGSPGVDYSVRHAPGRSQEVARDQYQVEQISVRRRCDSDRRGSCDASTSPGTGVHCRCDCDTHPRTGEYCDLQTEVAPSVGAGSRASGTGGSNAPLPLKKA